MYGVCTCVLLVGICVVGEVLSWWVCGVYIFGFFFFQAEDGIRDAQESRGLGDVYKRQRGASTGSPEMRCQRSAESGSQI